MKKPTSAMKRKREKKPTTTKIRAPLRVTLTAGDTLVADSEDPNLWHTCLQEILCDIPRPPSPAAAPPGGGEALAELVAAVDQIVTSEPAEGDAAGVIVRWDGEGGDARLTIRRITAADDLDRVPLRVAHPPGCECPKCQEINR